jgi:hypothetical protein
MYATVWLFFSYSSDSPSALSNKNRQEEKKNVRENEAKTGNLKRKLELVDGIRRASDASAFRAISPATRSSSSNY